MEYTKKEIKKAFGQWNEGEISVKELLPLYTSMWDKKMWDLFAELIAKCNMPHKAQAIMVTRPDAGEIMLHYAESSGFAGEEIDRGNGTIFLQNPAAEKGVIPMIERFYLDPEDQEALFDPANPEKAGAYVRFYHKRWGLTPKLLKRARQLGYID